MTQAGCFGKIGCCGRFHIGKDRAKGRMDRVKVPGWWARKAERYRQLLGGAP